MHLTPEDWHNRFTRQARWTRDLRTYLYRKTDIHLANRILEIGSGTGAITPDFQYFPTSQQYSLDVDFTYLTISRRVSQKSILVQGDAHHLPYQRGKFDVCLCHFLLMWVEKPESVIAEMKRVTRSGGTVLAIAEPDYSGRIDYPDELTQIGYWQKDSLIEQGADPTIGKRLGKLFVSSGLELIEVGVLGGQWDPASQIEEFRSETEFFLHDLEYLRLDPENQPLYEKMIAVDLESRNQGFRILFVPTFYAWGRVRE